MRNASYKRIPKTLNIFLLQIGFYVMDTYRWKVLCILCVMYSKSCNIWHVQDQRIAGYYS